MLSQLGLGPAVLLLPEEVTGRCGIPDLTLRAARRGLVGEKDLLLGRPDLADFLPLQQFPPPHAHPPRVVARCYDVAQLRADRPGVLGRRARIEGWRL